MGDIWNELFKIKKKNIKKRRIKKRINKRRKIRQLNQKRL